MKARRLLMFIPLLLCSCGESIRSGYVARTGSAESIAPVKVGMTLEAAYAAIGGSGELVQNSAGGYSLIYHYQLGNYHFQVVSHISSSRRIESFIMYLTAAYESAENASECADFFKTATSIVSGKLGAPDFTPRFHEENSYIISKAIFTFSDSANVKVTYSYPKHAIGTGHCVISIYPGSPWAADDHFSSPDVYAPMMRTPWSRFK